MKLMVLPFLLVAICAGSAQAVTAPTIAATSFDALPKPLPLPYDERADAEAAVKTAMMRAKANGKLLLIDLGGNWCPDCRILAATMRLPDAAAFVRLHYEEVFVDIGRFDKNMEIPARYGIGRPEGVPALLIVDPITDELLNKGRTSALADARRLSPQALLDWIARWVPTKG